MAMWDASAAAKVTPLAPVPVRDMGQLVLCDVSGRREPRISRFLEGFYVANVFLNLCVLLLHRLIA